MYILFQSEDERGTAQKAIEPFMDQCNAVEVRKRFALHIISKAKGDFDLNCFGFAHENFRDKWAICKRPMTAIRLYIRQTKTIRAISSSSERRKRGIIQYDLSTWMYLIEWLLLVRKISSVQILFDELAEKEDTVEPDVKSISIYHLKKKHITKMKRNECLIITGITGE